jgi:hypothetical protein
MIGKSKSYRILIHENFVLDDEGAQCADRAAQARS